MILKRFTAKTPREALALVRQAFGEDAVVMSTKPCAEGVEVLAMAPEGVQGLERVAAATAGAPPASEVERDAERLSMSTLSFQDYVRDRMLRRREHELATQRTAAPAAPVASAPPPAAAPAFEPSPAAPVRPPVHAAARDAEPGRREGADVLAELRAMRGLIEQRFSALAFMEKLQRQPRQARLSQRLLDAGFSATLVRKLVEGLPADIDEEAWAAGVLERNLATAAAEPALEDIGGVYALVGPTGVGKTTSTAKLAAAFATRHGAQQLGLVTLDAYRMAAHEQLRAYGRILGVPVHTAHDRASLEDLLELLAGKRMVLIDTAGMAQRDTRTRELLEMLSHRAIRRVLVINAAAQGETIEDVLVSYRAAACTGVVLSKIDEAQKLAPALDALVRHQCKVLAVANGQRVPEDWHRLSAEALVQRALKSGGSPAWRLDETDVSLLLAAGHAHAATPALAHLAFGAASARAARA
jgi:flagellar biosynthesis protein FlhF